MERNLTRAIIIAALAESAACSKIPAATPAPAPTYPPAGEVVPSPTPVQEEEAFLPTPNVEKPFYFGEYNMAFTRFTIRPSEELFAVLRHVFGKTRDMTADIPLPVFGSSLSKVHEEIFEKAGYNNSGGNPYYVIETDQPNHLFVYFHAISFDSPGELARDVGGFVYRHPKRIGDILGKQVSFSVDGNSTMAEIVGIHTISQYEFEGLNMIYANTGESGIPYRVRTDKTPGTYYLTIISCQNKNPGEISIPHPRLPGIPAVSEDEAFNLNTFNRSFLTLKVSLP
ncbi:MAG TPA: hypothetical protein VJ227_00760 [Patescibacteria group bacterium]|nr:hypothetical protein [Patescibacteria group bacterium]